MPNEIAIQGSCLSWAPNLTQCVGLSVVSEVYVAYTNRMLPTYIAYFILKDCAFRGRMEMCDRLLMVLLFGTVHIWGEVLLSVDQEPAKRKGFIPLLYLILSIGLIHFLD